MSDARGQDLDVVLLFHHQVSEVYQRLLITRHEDLPGSWAASVDPEDILPWCVLALVDLNISDIEALVYESKRTHPTHSRSETNAEKKLGTGDCHHTPASLILACQHQDHEWGINGKIFKHLPPHASDT